MELWGPFLTVSGKRASFGSGRPEQRASGRALVVRRRELDHGFFSATWKLPVRSRPAHRCHALRCLHGTWEGSGSLDSRNCACLACDISWATAASVALLLPAVTTRAHAHSATHALNGGCAMPARPLTSVLLCPRRPRATWTACMRSQWMACCASTCASAVSSAASELPSSGVTGCGWKEAGATEGGLTISVQPVQETVGYTVPYCRPADASHAGSMYAYGCTCD